MLALADTHALAGPLGWIVVIVLGALYLGWQLTRRSYGTRCPHCGRHNRASYPVCSHCGRNRCVR